MFFFSASGSDGLLALHVIQQQSCISNRAVSQATPSPQIAYIGQFAQLQAGKQATAVSGVHARRWVMTQQLCASLP